MSTCNFYRCVFLHWYKSCIGVGTLLADSSVSSHGSGLKGANVGKTFDVCFPLLYLLVLGFTFISVQRAPLRILWNCKSRPAFALWWQTCFSELEFFWNRIWEGKTHLSSPLNHTLTHSLWGGGKESEVREWDEGERSDERGAESAKEGGIETREMAGGVRKSRMSISTKAFEWHF